MTSEECAFFAAGGICAPPEEFGFTCQWAKPKSGLMYCCANTSILFSEKDFEAQKIKSLFSGKEWEAERSKILFRRTIQNAMGYQCALDALFFEAGVVQK